MGFHYRIILKTADVDGAGTNADVEVRINGQLKSGWFVLDNPGDDRERGQTDIYDLNTSGHLGNVASLTLRLKKADEDRPDWNLEWARLIDYDAPGGCVGYQFSYNNWIYPQWNTWVEVELTQMESLGFITSPLTEGASLSSWEYLGGKFQGAPTVAAWAQNRLDVFVRGTNNHLLHKYWNGSVWSNWEDLQGELTDSPGVASWGPNRLDVFVRGKDEELWHRWWNGNAWSNWEYLGGKFQGAPTVAAWAQNRLDVFIRGTNNHLLHKCWNGSVWSNWEDLQGELTGSPGAASWGPNRLDMFVRGKNEELWHRWS